MFDIGFSEILLFGAIALIVLGPEKLPHAIRTAGRYYAKFRRTVITLQQEIENELDLAETRKQMQQELAQLRQTERDIQLEMEKLRSSVSQLQQNATLTSNTSESTTPISASKLPPSYKISPTAAITQPLYYRWFLLSEYDKQRRLPNAPFLPNYRADRLMF